MPTWSAYRLSCVLCQLCAAAMRRCGRATVALADGHSRKIRNSKRRIVVEVIRVYEAFKQIPTHLGRLIGALRADVNIIGGAERRCIKRAGLCSLVRNRAATGFREDARWLPRFLNNIVY
jgi:hypothetical protein